MCFSLAIYINLLDILLETKVYIFQILYRGTQINPSCNRLKIKFQKDKKIYTEIFKLKVFVQQVLQFSFVVIFSCIELNICMASIRVLPYCLLSISGIETKKLSISCHVMTCPRPILMPAQCKYPQCSERKERSFAFGVGRVKCGRDITEIFQGEHLQCLTKGEASKNPKLP